MPQIRTGLAALILAAGQGRRLGGGKLLLPWRGKPLILHVLEKALRIPDLLSTTIVTGYAAADVRRIAEGAFAPEVSSPLYIVHNSRWREGQSASLRCGIRALARRMKAGKICGCLILLGDQPLVMEETLRRLCRVHIKTCSRNPAHAVTAPVHQNIRGNPVVLSPGLFPSLLALRGDVGARNLPIFTGGQALLLPTDDPGILHDVDSPEDYAALQALS